MFVPFVFGCLKIVFFALQWEINKTLISYRLTKILWRHRNRRLFAFSCSTSASFRIRRRSFALPTLICLAIRFLKERNQGVKRLRVQLKINTSQFKEKMLTCFGGLCGNGSHSLPPIHDDISKTVSRRNVLELLARHQLLHGFENNA